MRFSLITLMTMSSLVAWVFAIMQLPLHVRGEFIGGSFLLVILALFEIAMTSKRNESGSLDYDKSTLLNALEPTFKIAFVFIVVVIIATLGYPNQICADMTSFLNHAEARGSRRVLRISPKFSAPPRLCLNLILPRKLAEIDAESKGIDVTANNFRNRQSIPPEFKWRRLTT